MLILSPVFVPEVSGNGLICVKFKSIPPPICPQRGLLVERGDVMDERTCLVEGRMDVRVYLRPLFSIQYSVTSPRPAHIHRPPYLTGLTTKRQGVELRLCVGTSPCLHALCVPGCGRCVYTWDLEKFWRKHYKAFMVVVVVVVLLATLDLSYPR